MIHQPTNQPTNKNISGGIGSYEKKSKVMGCREKRGAMCREVRKLKMCSQNRV